MRGIDVRLSFLRARASERAKKNRRRRSDQSSFNPSLFTVSLSLCNRIKKSKGYQEMSQILQLVQGRFLLLLHDSTLYNNNNRPLKLLPRRRTCLFYECQRCRTLHSSLQESNVIIDSSTGKRSIHSEARVWDDGEEPNGFPHVQTLRKFPKEELSGKVVMVRFDFTILLGETLDLNALLVDSALSTIKYLNHSGAKVLMISNWGRLNDSKRNLSTETVADHLSSILQLKVVPANLNSVYTQSKAEEHEKADVLLLDNLSNFREESANCSVFAKKLSSEVDIFVNDSFSQSHKILASTIGVSRYCYASVAGLCFEKQLAEVVEVTRTTKQPYFAIIGGGNLLDKASALQFLASKCDGLAFVGMMAFQVMHGLGLPVPLSLVEHCVVEHALKIIQLARERNIPVLLPKDFWCMNDCLPNELRIFPAHGISDGWVPVDLGPVSLNEISSSLSNCKKILWIGPVKFKLPGHGTRGASTLATVVETLSRSGCDVTAVGSAACKAIAGTSNSLPSYSLYENASVVWEFLKRRTLPGLAALDRAYPFEINWDTIFTDPAQPLVVDVGSGNGLFIFGMARRQKHLNFLGLENNKKLVKRCLDSVHQSGITNEYFIATNATSTFRSIISSYPGELALVSILCPNPDFNRPEHRWRMLQRSLVEAIADLLTTDGKVFFQSDVEAVALRMKDQFLRYSKGKLAIINNNGELKTDSEGWLKENPYGIRSDWEQHVIDRGAPMYRLMISKVHPC